jgi:hypothetical protein
LEPPPQPVYTAEEEDKLLASEGWKYVAGAGKGSNKGWWVKAGCPSTMTKPHPNRATPGELEEQVLKVIKKRF